MIERESASDNRPRWLRSALVVLIAIVLVSLTWLAGGQGEAAVLLWGGVVLTLVGAIR